MFRAIIVGPPGSGKGTISSLMVKTFGVKHVSSGDLLRLHLTSSQPGLMSAMKAGKLIPDDLVEQLVFPELNESHHWLLDGYPRTLVQARSLMKRHQVDMVINLDVPDKTIVDRLQGRWTHVASGRIYHTIFNPPKTEGVDDVTGEALIQREDDHPDVIRERLCIYHDQTNPMLDYFKQCNLLKSYAGTESNVLWPQIRRSLN